ncbi:MAG: hypothetical protein IKX51_08450 [Bacteroidales bacterium]|nr:hypothetical protein [Bacteroidales bacterium]
MKKCFKLLGLVLLATALTFSYTSCGGDDDDTTTQEPGPGPNPDPDPDPDPEPEPDENPFEGMQEGTVRVHFTGDGIDTLYSCVQEEGYGLHPDLNTLSQTIFLSSRTIVAHPTQGYITLPYYRILFDAAKDSAFGTYADWYNTYLSRDAHGWDSVQVPNTSYYIHTGDYFYPGPYACGPIKITRKSFNTMTRKFSAKIVINMVKTADYKAGSVSRVDTLTAVYYKVVLPEFELSM